MRYDPLYWGAVFPFGMYAFGTQEMLDAMGLPFLRLLPVMFFYIALAAWAATFTGFVLDLLRRLYASRS